MHNMTRALLLCLLSLLVACGGGSSPAYVPADLVITKARIWTGDIEQPWATALAISGDSIVAIGDDSAVDSWVGVGTELVESPGGLVVPGFIDAHVHLMESGLELSSVQLRDAPTPAEFSRRITEFSQELEKGEWIQGGTWDHQNWGGELPHRNWIDAATPDTPVFVVRLDGHMALANSVALHLAGISADTPHVEGGEIVRDADGTPTGLLKDNAMNLVLSVIPAPSAQRQEQALGQAMDYLAEHGVTSVHDMGYNWKALSVYRSMRAREMLRTRIYASVPLSSWERLAAELDRAGEGDEWLRIGGLKGFMDGSLGSHTAAFFEDFSDTPGDAGFFITKPDDVLHWAIAADAAGLQLLIHAIGDRANAELLDIFERVAARNGERDRRFRIEHAQHLRPGDIARIAENDVIPSMQPYHAIDDGRWAEKLIGAERAATTYAFRSLMAAGSPVSFGSDWSVAPASPLLGIYAATTRRTLDGKHPGGWIPQEKITVEQALVAFTRNGAFASFEESVKGSLAVGKLADLVIIDRDITAIDPAEIADAKVMRTIVGGKTVYRRD
jgi:predicted amidohydrolase YtcJ